MSDNLYKKLSEERKKQQEEGRVPEWYSTAAFQMFQSKYLYEANDVSGQFERIARTAAKHLRKLGSNVELEAKNKFYEMLWKGWLSPSTPVLANMGTNRGLPVSCSGSYVDDSIDGFYTNLRETALLTKHGFGTSSYLGDIRARGSQISVGGKASGVMPVFKDHIEAMRNVAQGTARRGAWAGYLPIDHGDFYELADYVLAEPDDANIGWVVTDAFIERLNQGDEDAIARYQRALKLKMVTGKGYFFFVDKANNKRPQTYVDHDLKIKSSNLCSEIMLFQDSEHTYTCVLSSLNLAKYDEWKDSDAIFWATVFLDCVAEEFIERARDIPGLEKAVRFTEKGRALGLGVCGFHTYLQKNMIAFESFEAHMFNNRVFKQIREKAEEATKWMAEKLGEPEWCRGYGRRNTHLLAIAPTKSTAILMGGVSEGINPDPAMTYTQNTAAGEVDRINPTLLALMKDRGVYTKKHIQEIVDASGSVQGVNWLTNDEKMVFRTAFEINQEAVLRLASGRATYLDQWQSLNLFFSAEEDEAWISHIHKTAFEDANILALYYVYSMSGVTASKDCEACS